ncbi:TPA: hypothetical protein ACSPZS_003772, partial [Aeromonas veronii]
ALRAMIACLCCGFTARGAIFAYPLSAIRYPLSAIRYPLSAIRYPLSAIRFRLVMATHFYSGREGIEGR